MTVAAAKGKAQRIQFDEVVKRIQDLPSLPSIVMELLNSIDHEDIDIGVLAKKVAQDQALSAKTLRLANSSFYATQSKVDTIQQAIALLGIANVRNLITAAAISGSFQENQFAGFNFKAFWRHSMATAVCAQLLAPYLQVSPDHAFTIGLLHDIGELVIVTRFPEHYAAMVAYRSEHDCHMLEAERAVLGIDHVVAGHALAVHWHFSEVMQNAILGHHHPEESQGGMLVSLVHVANSIVHALDLSNVEDDLVPPISLQAWQSLNLDEETYQRVFRETVLHFQILEAY